MVAAPGCGSREPGSAAILLVSFDTTRADHVSAYGYARDTTPNLRRLAEQGVRFGAAYAPTATTGPTHASLFTGIHPPRHGVVKNGAPLGDEWTTLAEALARHGFATGAVVSSFVLASKFGYARGFERYGDRFEGGASTGSTLPLESFAGRAVGEGFDRRGDATTRLALQELDALARDGRPFFLFVHYFDPHIPYQPPESFANPFPPLSYPDALGEVIRAYDAEIAFVDAQLGRLLAEFEARGLAQDTLVVVTADHGEGLMQRGRLAHGIHIYEEAVRVPLVVRWPGRVPPGRTLESPVSLVDLPPAILALVGADAGWEPRAAEGRELAAALRGEGDLDPRRPVFLYRRHYAGSYVKPEGIWAEGEKFGVRIGDWKYIEGPAEGTSELYDLASDPREARNLLASQPPAAAALRQAVADWRHSIEHDPPMRAVAPEDQLRLEALGYAE